MTEPNQISFNKNMLVIGGRNSFHIKKVEVFTGDDNYLETDCIDIVTSGGKLEARHLLTNNLKRSEERIRFEPGIRLHLQIEGTDRIVILSICHHKGSIIGRII